MIDGYDLFDELWNERRPFSRFEAVLYMIRSSENGRFEFSQRKIAFKWGRTRDWVMALLKKLKKCGIMIEGTRDLTVVSFSVEQLAVFVEHTSEHTSEHTTLHTTNRVVNQNVAKANTPPNTPPYTPPSIPLKEQEADKEESVPLNNPLYKEEKEEEKEKQKNSSLTSAMKREERDLFGGADAPLSTASVDAVAVDWKKLLDFFNATVNGSQIPKIKNITEERRKFIRARIKEFGKNAIMEVIMKAAKSDFLNGGGNEAFIASFDWIFRPRNFPKILEGNYDNKNNKINGNIKTDFKSQRDVERERRDREAAELMSRLAKGLY